MRLITAIGSHDATPSHSSTNARVTIGVAVGAAGLLGVWYLLRSRRYA